MAKRTKALVSPNILKWARMSAGYTTDDVAARLKKTVETIEAIENDHSETVLTIGQIRTLAELYKRPLSDFFLPKPPEERPLPHDFRSPVDGHEGYSPSLIKELRRANARRDYALSLFDDLKEEIPQITTKIEMNAGADKFGDIIRELCGVDYEQQKQWGDGATGYKAWRERLGRIGCLVFQFDTVPIDEVLGFSLTDRPLPVIAVNVKMKPNGRTFTMLHEFVHVLLQKSSVCDLDDIKPRRPADLAVEVFCNASAAAALMPKQAFLSHPIVSAKPDASTDWSDEEISAAARNFGASREAFVRRLLTLNKTTQTFYAGKRGQYIAERARLRNKEREKNKDKQMRRSWSERAISNLDRPFVNTVLRGYHDQYVTMIDAAKLLDVRPEKIRDVEERLIGVGT